MTAGVEEVRTIMGTPEDVAPMAPEDHPGPRPDTAAPGAPPPDGTGAAPPEKAAAGLPLNDVGNGRRFAAYFGQDVISVPRVGWFVWTGQVWAKDDDELAVRRLGQKVSARIVAEAAHVELSAAQRAGIAEARATIAELGALATAGSLDREQAARVKSARTRLGKAGSDTAVVSDARSRHLAFAQSTGNTNKIDHMLAEAKVNLHRPLEDLDAAPLAVNTASGVLQFTVDRPGGGASAVASVTLTPHARAPVLTKMMPVAHDPAAQAPRFDAFLARIQPDPEMRGFLQRWFGLSMTALTGDQKMVFLYGQGANGKSVLVDLMARMLGDYATTAKIESLTGQNRRGGGDATPDLVPLMGARAVRASEPEQGERLKEGIIKELTGGEPILVRALHSDFVEIRPQFKLTISGNHKPEIRGTDDGIWRRVLLAPFDVQIPEPERDPVLVDKLWCEAPGVLNWLVAGLLDYLEGGLRPPEAIVAATEMYREESDPVGTFLTECAEVRGGDAPPFTPTKDLVEAFNFWLEDRGEGRWTNRTIAMRLKDKAGRWRDPRTGLTFSPGKRSSKGYVGLELTDTFRRRMADLVGRGNTGASPPDEAAF